MTSDSSDARAREKGMTQEEKPTLWAATAYDEITDESGRMVAYCYEHPEVIPRIVRAVNSHDALVAAVREALKWQDEDEFGNAVPDEFCTPLYRAYKQQLRDALKLAETSK